MILSIRIDNFKTFNMPIELSMEADKKSKKFFNNYVEYSNINVLKSVGVYGKNNVGKSCLIDAVKSIKNVLLNRRTIMQSNIFVSSPIVCLGVSFIAENVGYSLDFKYNTIKKQFIYERYETFDTEQRKSKVILLKDCEKNEYKCEDKNAISILPNLSNDNIILYTMNTDKFKYIKSVKDIFTDFAKKISIVSMIDIPIEQTIEDMKRKGDIAKDIANFIKNADLEISDFEYNDKIINEVLEEIKNGDVKPNEKIFDNPKLLEQLKLIAYHKDTAVPFMLFDSTGTKKIASIASYILHNIKDGGTLFIDELDSGLHFKLSRAIVAMYNNASNTKGQLIFTTHDINLMDCKKLLRKEQIWFADKDDKSTYLYSLNDFKARDGVRGDSGEMSEYYKKGVFSNLPDPDLVNWLMEVNGEK